LLSYYHSQKSKEERRIVIQLKRNKERNGRRKEKYRNLKEKGERGKAQRRKKREELNTHLE
jgi:hypothetical protein